jgi:hypothetical protein
MRRGDFFTFCLYFGHSRPLCLWSDDVRSFISCAVRRGKETFLRSSTTCGMANVCGRSSFDRASTLSKLLSCAVIEYSKGRAVSIYLHMAMVITTSCFATRYVTARRLLGGRGPGSTERASAALLAYPPRGCWLNEKIEGVRNGFFVTKFFCFLFSPPSFPFPGRGEGRRG